MCTTHGHLTPCGAATLYNVVRCAVAFAGSNDVMPNSSRANKGYKAGVTLHAPLSLYYARLLRGSAGATEVAIVPWVLDYHDSVP
jgi:hypothetical protein